MKTGGTLLLDVETFRVRLTIGQVTKYVLNSFLYAKTARAAYHINASPLRGGPPRSRAGILHPLHAIIEL